MQLLETIFLIFLGYGYISAGSIAMAAKTEFEVTTEFLTDPRIPKDSRLSATGCLVDGIRYKETERMPAKYCEYCFCVLGDKLCLKPKCKPATEGCKPIYESSDACCPSRYVCGGDKPNDQSKNDTSLHKQTAKNTTGELFSTETSSSNGTETEEIIAEPSRLPTDCVVNGSLFRQGEVVPGHKQCHNCYCWEATVICEPPRCAPPIKNCDPIQPEDCCCPVLYDCGLIKSGPNVGKRIFEVVRPYILSPIEP